ncbi:MAG: iron export ABC transporter permease subunit FetB [Bacteroidetes bacterium]|nr:iron export ABC transporter permease subunit FetB [Bacteroidota bacterium]
MTGALDIGYGQLALSLIFILAGGIASLRLKLGLERDLLWGTVRTVSQLALMAVVLAWIFEVRAWYIVVPIYGLMIFFAARIIRGRVRTTTVRYFVPTFLSMLLSYMLVTFIVVDLIVQARPWYMPEYFLPLGGMVIGNSMNAIAIALDRLFNDLLRRRGEVELLLCLGATGTEASADMFRDAVKAGMIPSINAMMGVGLVTIPGMMTGQLLAGSDPLVAVKYQIMVMLMLVGSTAIGSVLVISLVRRRCFSADHRLTVRAADRPRKSR